MAKGKKKTGCIVAIIIFVLLIVAAVIGLRMALSSVSSMMNAKPYGEVKVQNLSSYVNVSGLVASSETISVTSELQEKIVKLNVKVGDSVKKGDVLCEFDSTELQAQFDKLSASSDQAQDAEDYKLSILRRNLNEAKQEKTSSLNKAQQAINAAEKRRDEAYNTYNSNVNTYNRLLDEIEEADEDDAIELQKQADALWEANQELYPLLSQYDEAVTSAYNAYNDAKRLADQGIQAAQDQIDSSKYTVEDTSASEQLKKLQEAIDNCSVVAESDGVVTKINVTEGSAPVSPILMVIENTNSLMIRGKVDEADILRVEEGMVCEIKTTATDQDIINGSVKRIEKFISAADMESGNPGYAVEISIDDPDSKLLIGMSANIKIIIDKVDQALSVPYESIRGGENEGYFVYAAEPGEAEGTVKVVKKPVETGFEGDYYTQITGGDLKEGDIVFTGKYGDEIPQEGSVIPDPTLLNPAKDKSAEDDG